MREACGVFATVIATSVVFIVIVGVISWSSGVIIDALPMLNEHDPRWIPRVGQAGSRVQVGQCGQIDGALPLRMHQIKCPEGTGL